MATVHVLAFNGELDLAQAPAIERAFSHLEFFDPNPVAILDLREVAYLDTTFLNALVRFHNRALKKAGGGHIFVVAGERASRLFRVTGLDEQFPVFASMHLARSFAEGLTLV